MQTTKDPIVISGTTIDPIDYAIRANANLGIKETGKSYLGGYMAEQLMKRGIPVTVISPSPGRVWRHLKIGRPGKEGFPVVVVGDDEDADLRLTKETAGDIMLAAMKEGVSVVFDVFSKNLTKSDFRAIVKDVCHVLLYENENYGLRHLFLEEAGDLIPQKVYDKATYSAVEQLIRVGGNSGIGVTIMNPRAEGVNKEALELCEQLFLFKQTGKNSLLNLDKWLQKVDASNRTEVIRSLSSLEKGQCWFWDASSKPPAFLQVPEKDTVHPDRRQLIGKAVITKTGVDVTSFVARMTKALAKQKPVNVVPVSNNKTQGPAFENVNFAFESPLREKIVELEKQIELLRTDAQKERKAKQDALDRLDTVRNMLLPQYQQMQTIFGEVGNGTMESGQADSTKYDHWFPALVGYQKDMLRFFIQHRHLTTKKLALLLGRTINGTFTEYLGQLKRKGLINEDGDGWTLVEL